MFNAEYNYQEIDFKTLNTDREAELRFPYWDTSTVKVVVISSDEKVLLEEDENYQLTTYEEAKRENRFIIKILKWPDGKEEEWQAKIKKGEAVTVYIRRYSDLVQNYDPDNYKTPSPQEISKTMDNIVGMIQDTYTELSEEILDVNNLVSITLSKDVIPIFKNLDDQTYSFDEAYTVWKIMDQKGNDVTSEFECAYSITECPWIVVDSSEFKTAHKMKITGWTDNEKTTGSVQLTFTRETEEGEIITFIKYATVTVFTDSEGGQAYILTILSDNGDVFKPGEDIQITLTAYIHLNGVELSTTATETYNPYAKWYFVWREKQVKSEGEGTIIKEGYGEKYRYVKRLPTDVNSRANYTCTASKEIE